MKKIIPLKNIDAKLVFKYGFSEQEEYEAEVKGYLSHVNLEFINGEKFPLVFYDPVRLSQDLDEEEKHGRPFIAEKNLIVLSDISIDKIIQSITQLIKEDFFN